MKKTAIIVAVVALIVALFFALPAVATDGNAPEPCVPRDAYTETIEHPAETHTEKVIDTPAVPAIAEVWANFQPNKHKGPFVGPPAYPSDPRGSWNVKDKIPGGHIGPDGVYSKGNPAKGGNWFYRQAGKDEIPATYKYITVVDKEAYTETIEHEAVTCEEPPVENEVVTPTWKVEVSCLTPRNEWITAESTDAYTAKVYLTSGHLYEIEFTASEGYEFSESDRYVLSDDKGRAVVTGRFPVLRCIVPEDEPEIGTPEVETRCTANKCVKITRENGVVTDKETVEYGNDVVEEGL